MLTAIRRVPDAGYPIIGLEHFARPAAEPALALRDRPPAGTGFGAPLQSRGAGAA